MSNPDLAQTLEEVQFAYFGGASPDAVADYMRQLARRQYAPAVPFFVTCLKDKRPEWRSQSLMLLGSYYDLVGNEPALEGLRTILRQDLDPLLRRKAIEFLSLFATWPEPALIDALQADPDLNIRYAALQAALELAGVPRLTVRDEIAYLRAGGAMPTMRDVERITRNARQSQGPG